MGPLGRSATRTYRTPAISLGLSWTGSRTSAGAALQRHQPWQKMKTASLLLVRPIAGQCFASNKTVSYSYPVSCIEGFC